MNPQFYGNTLLSWIIACAVGVSVFFVSMLIKNRIASRLEPLVQKKPLPPLKIALELLRHTKVFFLVVVAIFFGLHALSLPPALYRAISILTVLAFLFQMAIWFDWLIYYFVSRYVERAMVRDAAAATTAKALGIVLRLILWALILLLALDNMGIDVTAVVAGLGIGGVAVALAVQNILGDLFSSFSIVLDKPFLVGDFIVIDDFGGTVEHVGLKTTRLRSLSGEQLVFSNSDLLRARIRNYKRMYERRVVFSFGVIYQTPSEKLSAIPDIVKAIITSQERTRFDRAHFLKFGNSSLDFEVVYYVLSPDYNVYMDTQQAINLAIYERFAEEGIEFAYPTQTVYLKAEALPSQLAQGEATNEAQ
ncbi:MAG TPA: mechanosensitive ion channel family protein [Thermosynergistes sp.]|nr:mechanosensitive ion channel family protein [Thermosynergistes sp.]